MECLFFYCLYVFVPGTGLLEFFARCLRLVVAIDDVQDLLSGIEQIADGTVVVERIDEISEVFAHTAAHIPGTILELRFLVDQVCCDDLVELAFRIGLVEFLDATESDRKSVA